MNLAAKSSLPELTDFVRAGPGGRISIDLAVAIPPPGNSRNPTGAVLADAHRPADPPLPARAVLADEHPLGGDAPRPQGRDGCLF